MSIEQAEADLRLAIQKSFDLVQRQIENFYPSHARAAALAQLDLAYLHALHLLRDEITEAKNARTVRLRSV